MWPKMFSSRDAEAFARELAAFILDDLGQAVGKPDPKFRLKAEKALNRAARRIDQFKATTRLNWFQRSRASNAFLWTLKERECPKEYADELTEWFVMRV
jgi:hypothetical protein